MSFVFNPFTKKLDEVDTQGGVPAIIHINDAFGGSAPGPTVFLVKGDANGSGGSGLFIHVINGDEVAFDINGGALNWTESTTTPIQMGPNNGYIANYSGTLIYNLPGDCAIGAIIRVTGMNNASGWKIAQAAGTQINFGTQSTTVGVTGYLASTNTYDSVELVCTVAPVFPSSASTWNVLSSVGNITVN